MNKEVIINNLLIFLRDRVSIKGTAEAESLLMCKAWLMKELEKLPKPNGKIKKKV